MLYGEKFVDVDKFLPRIQSSIDGIDTDMAISYIMDAVIQFCRESQLIRRVKCINLECCTTSYPLEVSPNERLSELMAVRVFSNGCASEQEVNYYIDNDVLYVHEIPHMNGLTLEVEYTVVPKRDSTVVPEVIYEDWVNAVTHLAFSWLYSLGDMEWANLTVADYHARQYQTYLRQARFHTITKHKPLKMKLRPHRRGIIT